MRALFDVNMLLALFDAEHMHHPLANSWWNQSRNAGWASCAITQNGFLRIISGRSYPRSMNLASAVSLLRSQIAIEGHELWGAGISITDPDAFDHSRISGPNQITDVYLLALAVKNNGRLVTFDRAIPSTAVRGAEERHLVVL